MAEVVFDGVSKVFKDGTRAVDELSLDIADGEFMVLVGPSGCGKTTALRMVGGLEEITDGNVRIGERIVNDLSPKSRDIAMVFQSYALYPHLSVADNIGFALKTKRVPKDEIRKRVLETARMLDLEPYLKRKPRALSGGQRQRVAMGRAIIRQPQVFLMDEPLSNLDAKLRLTMRAQLKHIQRQLKTTTIYVTHDQIEAMTLADRIAIMEKGAIQQLGTPDEVYNHPNNIFVASFIGSPPMNLIKGSIENGTFSGPDTRIEGVGHGNRGDVVLGVRPEDMEITGSKDGHLLSKLYSLEPTGDLTLVTAWAGEQLVVAKSARNFRQPLDTPIAFRFPNDRVYFFDGAAGDRL
jgi:multiple sugar transport system ATP-binding protein